VVNVALSPWPSKALLPSSTVLQHSRHYHTAFRQHPTQGESQALVWLRTRIGDKIFGYNNKLSVRRSVLRVRKVWLSAPRCLAGLGISRYASSSRGGQVAPCMRFRACFARQCKYLLIARLDVIAHGSRRGLREEGIRQCAIGTA
jgi:hypothetical protein